MHVVQVDASESDEKDLTQYTESKIYPNTHNRIDFTKAIHLTSW